MNEQKKLCRQCDTVKDLNGSNFYKAGNKEKEYYQKYCIPCHNKNRNDYKASYKYEKKLKGFQKLPEETRNKILYDISVRINYKEISEKYNLNYQTLCIWKRKNYLV